jgi:uncharacterized protein (TIGR04255 family)
MSECLTDEETIFQPLEYRAPPVVETALAIEFAPPAGWNLVHYGALWETCYRETYPKIEIHPATMPGRELDLSNPPIRFFFTNPGGTELVQLRSGAFIRNWRARSDEDRYPRYRIIRPSFERDLQLFYDFLAARGFSPPEVWKCEVTYVNHFLRGREWSNLSDLYKVLPALGPATPSKVLADLSQVQMMFNYELPNDLGNLQIQLVPGLRSDGKEILQLTLTAYGKPKGGDLSHLMQWLDQGRRAVGRGFSDFTSAEVQTNVWGRKWPS